jgi:phospholipid/cholesterol/gamma-HCH transport system substrate-binding protein
MPRHRRWSELVPGVLALVALIAGAAAVLVLARVGGLRGKKLRLYATVAEARGLSAGSEVWLAGERIGVVDRIGFLPAATDTAQRLVLVLSVLARHREFIRRGAPVRVESGGNMVGAPVVAIALGSPGAAAVHDGDTLRAERETDSDRMRAEFQQSAQHLPAILANARVLRTQLTAATGTLGALGIEAPRRVSSATARLRSALATVRSPTSTLSRVRASDGAMGHVRHAMAQADSVRALLAQDGTRSLGRFRRDSTLLREVESVQRELAVAARLLAEPRGAAGRLQHDSALALELARARQEVSAVVADLKRNPLRYLAF